MNYSQIDVALSFLEPDSYIVLQVPYYQDIKLVIKYLFKKLGEPQKFYNNNLIYGKNRIKIESIESGHSGYGVEFGRLFFIDRDHDRSYLNYLE
jgi:hypothetical protein